MQNVPKEKADSELAPRGHPGPRLGSRAEAGMIAAPVTGKCRDSRVVHLPKGIEDGARELELRTATVRVCVVVTA